jgi:RNase P/RNase MRP subunit p30
MINTSNIEEAKKRIKNSKEKPIIVLAKDSAFNRKIAEYGKFDILMSVEYSANNQKLRTLDSGLNEILARIAQKNDIAIGLDIKEIKSLDKKRRAIVLERVIQNIRICRKTKCKIRILNYNNEKTAFSFLLSLGASTLQAKEATSF